MFSSQLADDVKDLFWKVHTGPVRVGAWTHWEKWVLLGGEGKGRILVAVLASQQDITMISPGEI